MYLQMSTCGRLVSGGNRFISVSYHQGIILSGLISLTGILHILEGDGYLGVGPIYVKGHNIKWP